MGKSVKNKQRVIEAAQQAARDAFAQNSRIAATPPPVRPLEEELADFHAHMIRPCSEFILKTRSSNRQKQLLELARFVFGRYRVPKVLDQVWGQYMLPELPTGQPTPYNRRAEAARLMRNPNLARIDFRHWYVCVATGGSLYKEHTKTFLTKKETHLFLTSPHGLDLGQTLVAAVAQAAGAAPGMALRLARSKLAIQDLTSSFWLDAIRYFSRPDCTPSTHQEVSDLVDFIQAKHQEDRNFRLIGTGQSLQALLRRKEEWHRALARAKILGDGRWEGAPLPNHQEILKDQLGNEVVWDFYQITSAKELAAEGTAMRHCVLSYRQSCVSGKCSIWSLGVIDKYGTRHRKITIELLDSGVIVQKRGLANRLPRSDENNAIARWAQKMGLGDRTW